MYNKEAVMVYNNLKMPESSRDEIKKPFSTGLLSRINYEDRDEMKNKNSLDSISKYVSNIRKARQDLKNND